LPFAIKAPTAHCQAVHLTLSAMSGALAALELQISLFITLSAKSLFKYTPALIPYVEQMYDLPCFINEKGEFSRKERKT